jgi:glycosyltransferase involved in cell wall biosynthesis
MAKDEFPIIGRAITSALKLADEVLVLDTGSSDFTIERACSSGASVKILEWEGFGPTLTKSIALAGERGHDWLLRLDADMTIESHEDLGSWLAEDKDPMVEAWEVEIVEPEVTWCLPLLTRSGREWRYEGPTHEFLDTSGVKTRRLLGLTVTHHKDSSQRGDKLERDLGLLESGYLDGDARSTFYYAETLSGLGRTDEAVEAYRKRVALGAWEEERWFAQFRVAELTEDIELLLECHHDRPWRHEPLTVASKLVSGKVNHDLLFNRPWR